MNYSMSEPQRQQQRTWKSMSCCACERSSRLAARKKDDRPARTHAFAFSAVST